MNREKVISNLNGVHEYLRHFENTAKMGEWVSDAIELIHDQQSQIAMLVVAQHELCEMMKEQEAEKKCYKDCEYYGSCHDI